MRMVRNGFVDAIEQIYDELESLYEEFKNAILDGILMAFEQKPRLDFFIFSTKLNTVKGISEEIVLTTQKFMTDKTADECRKNLKSITLYTCCKIEAALYGNVEYKPLKELMTLLQQEDPFYFEPNHERFESLRERTEYTAQEFESIFAQGGA